MPISKEIRLIKSSVNYVTELSLIQKVILSQNKLMYLIIKICSNLCHLIKKLIRYLCNSDKSYIFYLYIISLQYT